MIYKSVFFLYGNLFQLAEEEILQERTACDELRDELEQAVDDIDQWKKSFEELDASMKEAVYRHAQEVFFKLIYDFISGPHVVRQAIY